MSILIVLIYEFNYSNEIKCVTLYMTIARFMRYMVVNLKIDGDLVSVLKLQVYCFTYLKILIIIDSLNRLFQIAFFTF